MPINFTRRGYIEVWRDGQRISQHTQEREALERITVHHAENGDGDYEIRSPLVVAKAYGVLPPGGDTTAPSTPGSVQANALNATSVRVTWTASTDNIAVAGYQVFRNGSPLDTTTNLTFDDTGLTPSTQYSYTVTAFDAAGNNSTAGGPALATTNANSAPVWSQGNVSLDNGDGVSIGLDGVCTDADGDTLTYSLVSGTLPTGLALSGARNETLSGTVTADGVYNFTLGASDGIAAVQTVALTFTVTTPDTTAPDAPSAPTVNAVTSSTITLNLPTSGAVDHAGYQVWRSTDGTNFGNRSGATLVTDSTWLDTGLNASATYYYALVDVDTSANASALGASVSQETSASGAAVSHSYTVTHYVDLSANIPGNPGDWVDQGSSAWAAATNPSTPCTLRTACFRATPGNVVQVAPGGYYGPSKVTTEGGTWEPEHTGGTSEGNRVIYVAQYPATSNLGNQSLWSTLGINDRSGAAAGANGVVLGVFGAGGQGSSYNTFDGFHVTSSATFPASTNGLIRTRNAGLATPTTHNTFRRLYVDHYPYDDTTNYAAFQLSKCQDTIIEDCYFESHFGETPASPYQLNSCALEWYGGIRSIIRYNRVVNPSWFVFFKGGQGGVSGTGTIYNNRVVNYGGGVVQFAELDTGGMITQFYQNLCTAEQSQAAVNAQALTKRGFDLSPQAGNAANLRVFNNTIYVANGVHLDTCAWRMQRENYPNSLIRDNIYYFATALANPNQIITAGNTFLSNTTDVAINNDWFYNSGTALYCSYVEGSDFNAGLGSIAALAASTGWYGGGTPNYTIGDPQFENISGGDFKLQAGSAARTASTTNGPVGAYITGSEEIGIRASPPY